MPTPFNNYEIMRDQMAGAFLRYDQEAMIQKFSLKHDADFLYIRFVGREYRIARHNGAVSWEDTDSKTVYPADYNAAMTIYDVLCCSKENCHTSGEMVSIESCASVQGGSLSSQNRSFFQHAADWFDKEPSVLSAACESLGGACLARGDVAYQLNLFDFRCPSHSGTQTKNFRPACKFWLTGISSILCTMRRQCLRFHI